MEMSATLTWSSSTPCALHAVVDHDVAEGAGGRDRGWRRWRAASWVRSTLTFLPVCSSIHMRAPPAPQHMPLVPLRRHLDDLDAAERADHLAGRQVHVVVAAEVAGVVVDDPLLERGAR